MTDFELLQEYSAHRSEEAFAALARRYTNLVYSAALRQTPDSHAAEEIAQVVFIILARKSSSIRHGVVLSGWLLRTTRFVALNTRRRELHRRQIEQEAMNMNTYPTETSGAWKPRLRPVRFILAPQRMKRRRIGPSSSNNGSLLNRGRRTSQDRLP